MHRKTGRLAGTTPGTEIEVTFLHFGTSGARPKIYIQGGLHADEAPGQLTAHHLGVKLAALEAEGRITGEIVLVPVANPLGLTQSVLGTLHGRFSLADGVNFNREFADLAPAIIEAVAGKLGSDGAENIRLIRAAALSALNASAAIRPAAHLKRLLLAEAIDADIVLDLHCDSDAVMHLYTLPGQAEALAPLAAFLGARAILTADISGDNPFDEAVSSIWPALRAAFPHKPIPDGAIATTVELRGDTDVDHDLANRDAEAILDYLGLRGALKRDVPCPPPLLCQPTPLAGSEAVEAPVPGIIVMKAEPGAMIAAGDVIADIVDPVAGTVTPVAARTSGILFARTSARFAHPGRRLGKIAGATAFRTGKLLSP